MVETYQRRSALAHLGLALRVKPIQDASVFLQEMPRRAIFNIRGQGNDFADALWRATKLHLPKPNQVQTEEHLALTWMGPDEYWLIGAENAREASFFTLKEAFTGMHAALTDLSESRTILRLSGKNAPMVLARGMSIDLHPSLFSTGQCAQTSLGRANILLHQTGNIPEYEIYVLNSFADYLWRWIEKVAEPFGCQIRV